jgi:hypothetical protein
MYDKIFERKAYVNTAGTSCVGGCLRVGLLWQQFTGGNLSVHPGAALSPRMGKNIGGDHCQLKTPKPGNPDKKRNGENNRKTEGKIFAEFPAHLIQPF